MGWDNWPEVMVPAVMTFLRFHQDTTIALYWNREKILDVLKWQFIPNVSRLEIIDSQDDIPDNGTGNPLRHLAKGEKSSIMQWIRWVKDGVLAGFMSRWNTGAFIVGARRELGEKDKSLALSAWFPREENESDLLVMDVWAEVDTTLAHITRNTELWIDYLKLHWIISPRIALLNIGKEPYKWDKAYTDAHKKLKEVYGESFLWNIEPNSLVSLEDPIIHEVDLVVSGGTLWNSVLKTAEGAFVRVKNGIKDAAFGNPFDAFFNMRAGMQIRSKLGHLHPDNRPDGIIHGINWDVRKIHGGWSEQAVVNGLIRMRTDMLNRKREV